MSDGERRDPDDRSAAPALAQKTKRSPPVPFSTVPGIRAMLLPVRGKSGETLYYVSADAAKRMIAGGRVTAMGTKQTIRALQLGPDFDDSKIATITDYTGQHYSHDHATKVNPEGCWTLKRLSKRDRPLFQRVQTDCIRYVSPMEWHVRFGAEAA
jgi:hypothetical protein